MPSIERAVPRAWFALCALCGVLACTESGPVGADVSIFDAGVGSDDRDGAIDGAIDDGAIDGGPFDGAFGDGALGDGTISDGAIDGGPFDGAFGDGALGDGTISDGAIDGGPSDGAFGDGALGDGTISDGAIDGGPFDGAFGDGALGDGTISDGAIDPFDGAFGDGALGDGTISDGAIDGGPFDGAFGDGALGDGTISDGAFADGALGDGAVSGTSDAGPSGAADSGTSGGDAGVFDAADLPDSGSVPLPSAFVRTPIDTTILGCTSVQAIDVDLDGDLDAIATSAISNDVRLYVNGGTGTWVTVPLDTNIAAMESAVADLDGDLDLDVAAIGLYDPAAPFASPGEIAWYENPGTPLGSWTVHAVTAPDFYGPRSLRAGDLTGDGLADLVIGRQETYDAMGTAQGQGLFWLRNTGGAFAAPIAIEANLGQIEALIITDVDLDGVHDVVASSTGDGEVDWFENLRAAPDPAPAFARHTMAIMNRAHGLALANLDGDLQREVFATFQNGTGGALVWLDAPIDPRQPWTITPIDTSFGDDLARADSDDLNGDGRSDVVVLSTVQSALRVYYRDPFGNWLPQVVAAPYPGGAYVHAGDIDGDLRTDLAACTFTPGGPDEVVWFRNVP